MWLKGGADCCLFPPQSRCISGAIATGNRFIRFAARRTALLKNPFRRALAVEKQCFGDILSKHVVSIRNLIINQALLLFSRGENIQKARAFFYSAPVHNTGMEYPDDRILKQKELIHHVGSNL